jgi:hypothetical protein
MDWKTFGRGTSWDTYRVPLVRHLQLLPMGDMNGSAYFNICCNPEIHMVKDFDLWKKDSFRCPGYPENLLILVMGISSEYWATYD